NTLRHLEQRWEADPARLDEVERRLQSLRRLEGKYGKNVDELIIYRLTLDEKEQQLQQQEDDLGGIQAELAEVYVRLKAAAAELSKQRRKVAKKLATETQRQLADLGMAEAKLDA